MPQPYVPVADTVMVELRQRLFGERIENTLYFRKTGGFSVANMTGLLNDLLVWWNTYLAPHVSLDLTLKELVCTDLSTQTGPVVQQAAPTPNPAGDVAVPSMPGNVALCVSLKTNNRGRSYRGRNFVAGIPTNAVLGNTVLSGTVNGIEGAYSTIPFAVTTSAWDWVVVSRITAGAPRVAGVATPVSAVTVIDSNIDSMRRRLAGRGQ